MADGNVTIVVDADDSEAKKKLEGIEDIAEDAADGFEKMGDSADDAADSMGKFSEKEKETQKETEKTVSKFEELNDTINKQQNELSDLKNKYTEAIVNFGKGSTEAKELKDKIDSLNSELGKNKESLGKAKSEADKLTSSLEDTEKGFGAADVAVGDFVSDGLQNLIGKLGESIQSLFALAEETREFRDDMAKLDSAFTTNGHSAEAAKEIYNDFYKILGESDRSVEAVNHLAEFTKNEQELAQWSTICAGVTAKFGDSLPIEGLTEAANETAKVGAVTGPLADALNWAGISEDDFNEKLKKCNSEQERASLITSTLNGLYEDEAAKYNELTASTQAAREATANMEHAQADLGAAIEPLTTAWTNLKANALEAITPVIQSVVTSFQNLSKWMDENPGKAEIIKGVLLGIAAALGVIAIALGISGLVSLLTTAFATLSSVLAVAFSPVTLIIAAIAGLVAAFLYLWNNCEAFRNFFISIWEGIKPYIEAFKEFLTNIFSEAWEYIKGVWEEVEPYFSAIWEAIKAVFSVVVEVLGAYFSQAWESIKLVWSVVVDYFKMIWYNITQVFSVVKTWFEGMFRTAWEAIKTIWNAVTGYFKAIWETIKGIFAVVKAVLSGNWSEAWEAIKGIVATWAAYFSGVWESIKSVFASVKTWFSSTFSAAWTAIKNIFANAVSTFSEIGSNIVAGIRQGISNAWNNLVSWFSGLFGDLKSIAKKILGIHSPSRVFRDEVGKMIVAGIEVGIEENKNLPVEAMTDVFDEMDKHLEQRSKEQIKTVADYNAEYRQEVIDHNKELEKLEADKNEDLSNLDIKYAESKAANNENLSKLDKDYAKDLNNLSEKLSEDKKKKNADSVKLEKEYNKKKAEIDEKYAENKKKINDNNIKLDKDYAEKKETIIEKYNNSVENLNKKHDDNLAKIEDQIRKTVETNMKELTDLEKKYKEDVKKVWDDLSTEIDKVQANYDNQLKSRTESIANSLNLFQEATKNKVSISDLRKNLKSQVNVLESYNKAISKLEGKTENEEFLNYIKGLGVGSTGEIETLAKMSENTLASYIEMWEKKNELAKAAATEELEPLKAETDAKITELTDAALEKYAELRKEFTEQSGLLMAELQQAIIDAEDAGFDEILSYVEDYNEAGGSLMDGVIEGIVDKSPAVTEAVKNAVRRAIAAAKEEAGIHSPSDVTKDEIGANLALGVGEGWKEKLHSLKNSLSSSLSDTLTRLRATVAAENGRFATSPGIADTGFNDLARAVGVQTAGINSLAGEYRRGAGSKRPIILELNKRELGRAWVDVGGTEEKRIGTKISVVGGAHK